MKGTRPLNNNEICLVSACFDSTFEARNRGLFMLGVSTGGRIFDLLGLLRVGDAYRNGCPVTDLRAIIQKKVCLIFANLLHFINQFGWHCYELEPLSIFCHPPTIAGG